ncbi:MAG: NAD(P)-dependent oxidoreductase, partial [Methanococcaceae archaeon]
LEAPVLGSIPQAKEGKLIVMVGGAKELFEQFKTLFEAFGPEPLYIGQVGKASALKLAFNQLIATLTAAFSLSLGIVQKENIEVEQFMSILRKSALYAKTFDVKLNNMLNDNFSSVNFPAKHLLKDINLTLNMTDDLKIDSTVLQAVAKILEKTLDLGNAEKDYSVLYDSVVTK